MHIVRRQRELKLGDNEGDDNFEFHHGEVSADAQASPQAKWDISLGEFASFRDPICKPFRPELVSIWSPNGGIPV